MWLYIFTLQSRKRLCGEYVIALCNTGMENQSSGCSFRVSPSINDEKLGLPQTKDERGAGADCMSHERTKEHVQKLEAGQKEHLAEICT